tara:strand:+ start:2077 stop:2751 length:675 start_codon:yes stop_codon:yes gene_type:complete
MNIKKIDLPNPGVIEAKLNQEQIDALWLNVHKYSPREAEWIGNTLRKVPTNLKQWNMKDDNSSFQSGVLMPMVEEYFSNYEIPFSLKTTKYHQFVLSRFWTRASTAGDYQSLHDHQGVFTFVVWLTIPFDGESEKNNQSGFRPDAGEFGLVYNNTCGNISKKNWTLSPDMEGTILLFPSDINHIVYPHYSTEDYRISVAGDIVLDSNNVGGEINPAHVRHAANE